ncbi:hypothetical protein niasHT_002875 [Heterodera trifolii]|uniref:non-specific serine/threonine protein kinase n=1 Tax=Heterodera trifolii TaxID=157864 RepID=A0ABD2M6Y6_9BILA
MNGNHSETADNHKKNTSSAAARLGANAANLLREHSVAWGHSISSTPRSPQVDRLRVAPNANAVQMTCTVQPKHHHTLTVLSLVDRPTYIVPKYSKIHRSKDLSAEFHHTPILRFVRSAVSPQLFYMDRPKRTPTNAPTPEEQQRMEYRIRKRYNSAGFLGFEGENATLEELILLRSAGPQRSKRLPPEAPPKPLEWRCTKCSHKPFETLRALSTHMRIHSGATHSPVRRPSIHTTIDFSAASPEPEEPPKAPEPPTEVPQERWVDPLPEKLQFQQQENKFAELKCKYSRANAKVRWYKGRKELFSDGPKYEILIDKQSITLIINNPDPDDSGKYKCEANGVPTNSFVTVEGPSIKYVFLTPLPNTMEIYRTKQGVLACKLDSPRAPLVWQRDGKPIDVDDPRYQIENDAVGRFTLTIRVVERIDQGMWTATVNKDVISKCQVYVVEERRDTFLVPLKSQSANEKENATFECDVNDKDIDVEEDEQLRNEKAAIEALRRANAEHELRPNDEHETESSDVDEDEYVVESDDDIPAVEANAVVERYPAPTFAWKKGGQKVPLTGLVRCQTDVDTGKDNAHAAPTATTSSSATTSTAGIYVASATERRSDANSFRVKTAATSNSQSTASAARTAIVSAVSDKVPAWLNHDDMNNLVVRAGQDAKWVVKFGGKPAPKVAWSKDQQLINPKTSAPIQVDTKTNDHTTLKIPATTRADCGAYTLLVSNSKGMDTKTAHLTVLGKPSKPLGPLEVNDVTEDGCVLRWKPPEDNGGLPIEHYEVEKLEGGKWVRCAKLSNCATKVKGLKKGQQYQFRVKAVNKEGKSEPLSTEHEIIAKNQYDEPGKPEPPIKYVFLTPLHNTMEIYRTKQGVLACKLNSARAPLVWQRDGKPIDVDDPRYQIEKDAAGCFTLTIHVVERIDQGMWTASVNKDVISKCQVYVVEDPRDTFVVQLKSKSANENENATFECEVNDEDIDVEWFHGDAKIKMDGRHFKEERVGCHRRLLITNLLIEDQGQYKCTTKDDKTMAQLTVDPLKKFECEAGKEKRIKVPFEVKGTRRGDPKPILLRNGKPVDLNKMKDHVEVIINGTVAEIVFKEPQKSEAGKWSLKLANTGGVSAEAAFELVVNGKPKTPKRPLNTLDVTSDSCIVPGGVRALKRQSILDRNTACEEEFDELLLLCGQGAAVSWADLEQSTGSFDNWSKIGEGAFGEVFRIDSIAVKVMPFAIKQEQCSTRVNGDYLKTAKFIFNELFITKQLTELSEDSGSDFVTPSFTQLRMRKIVKGYFPKKLLKAWDAFKKAKPELSENERPDIYADEDRHFVIIGLSYGGKDLEAYTIRNGHECYSIFHQLALSLAIAESVLEFEHRDLHAGNILVERCADNEKIRYIYQGKKINVVSNGVRASIIDFSISRLTKKGVPFFVDLSQDTGLFAQNGVSDGGDYQYDVYRMMKTVASENWSSFWPQTNVYWMGYAAKKLFNKNRFIRGKRKETIENLFANFETKFGSIGDFIDHPEFSSVFAEFTSGK